MASYTVPSFHAASRSSYCLPLYSWRLWTPAHFSSSPQHSLFRSHANITKDKLLTLVSTSCSAITPTQALPFELSPPPIEHDFLDTVTVEEAKVSNDGVFETFHNDDEALDAADNGVVVADLSHFGRIRGCDHYDDQINEVKANITFFKSSIYVSGDHRIQFLHNQSTANFESINEGHGCDTVFVTPTARTIDIAHAWNMKNAVILTVSPEISKTITDMLKKYIFFADKVEIDDISEKTNLFVLLGPKSEQVLENLNLGDLIGLSYGTHRHFSVNGMPVTIGVGSFISEKGFSMMMSPAAAGSVWKTLLSQGAIPMGSKAWERLRVIQGRPSPEKELTKDFNVLEAGLWNSLSLNKGCYKGQETISRLITYDGVKQNLWGFRLSGAVEPDSIITVDVKKVGKLTSYAHGRKESEHFGLGYIRRQGASEGDTIIVGGKVTGTVVKPPFLAWQKPPLGSSKPRDPL